MSLPGSVPYSLFIPFFLLSSSFPPTMSSTRSRNAQPRHSMNENRIHELPFCKNQINNNNNNTHSNSSNNNNNNGDLSQVIRRFMLIMRVSLEVNQKYQRTHAHRIHGTGIFTYIYHQHQVNICSVNIHGLYAMDLPRGC